MKQFFIAGIIVIVIGSLGSCKNGTADKLAADSANYTTVKWLDSIKSFDSINNGDKIEIKFRCKNTGSKPLLLINARPTCGCTVADYTKEPIAPGNEGAVTAAFDSKNFSGHVRKTIIVNTNTSNGTEHFLYFEGDIKGGPNNDKVVVPHAMPPEKKPNSKN